MIISPAYAQAAGAAQPDAFGGILGLAPLFLVFILFYFLMIRPQQKRMKALQQSVEAVKKGDTVTTAGGVVGKVTKVEANSPYIEVEIAPGTKVRVVKSTLAAVGSATPAND